MSVKLPPPLFGVKNCLIIFHPSHFTIILNIDAHSVHIKLDNFDVHDVADTMKRYLRSLQEPVMTSALYGRWLSATSEYCYYLPRIYLDII